MDTFAPTHALPMPAGPVCGACGDTAAVNWRRRPTDDELAEYVTAEQSRRDQILLLADPQQPAPVFPPLPTSSDTTRTVYACAEHAVTLDGAARIHEATCTAPNNRGVDGCDCTPESPPAPAPNRATPAEPVASRMPAHWMPGDA